MGFRILTATLGVTLLISCAPQPNKGPITSSEITKLTAGELVAEARESSEFAQAAKDRESQRNWALYGISTAEQCLMRAPEEPGCYYYRAINTGLYHEVKIIGYQAGVKQMIGDCEKVIEFDPKYDHGGAYRILGQIYTKLPQSVGRPDSVVRDLDKAEDYLRQAVRIDNNYPENHLLLAETLLEKENVAEATKELALTEELTPRWRQDKSHSSWQAAIMNLEKKLRMK